VLCRAYLVGGVHLGFRSTFGPRTVIFLSSFCPRRARPGASALLRPPPPRIKVRQLLMHQSDLYLPVPSITASRHATPARLPATAASPAPTWPQSLSNPPVAKKRNVERACDDCRRRKTRCDGSKMPDNVCTNCVQNRKICTYVLVQTFFTSNSSRR